MTTDEITAVADFILGLSGDTVADAVAGGDTEGGHLYATLCAACHGATGEGGIGGAIIGEDDDAAELAELIRNGDDGMPGFPDLTEAELDSLVAYTMDVMAGRVTVNEVTEDDASEPDETATADRNDNRSAAPMFLDNTEEGGKSPLIVVSMLVVLVGIAGTIGFMWLRTAKALVE